MREKCRKELWNKHQRLGGETEGTRLVWKEGSIIVVVIVIIKFLTCHVSVKLK